MSDLLLFVMVFGGLFVLRLIIATTVFLLVIPRGDRCPNCDTPTMRIESPLSDRYLPWLRKRWCLACGWQGMLRGGLPNPSAVASDQLTTRR